MERPAEGQGKRRAKPRLSSLSEASGFLVGPSVFKTEERVTSPLAGSIPVRLRVERSGSLVGTPIPPPLP
jgi:hypothetical protein